MKNSNQHTFAKNAKGQLITLEGIKALMRTSYGSICLGSDFRVLDYTANDAVDGNADEHFKANVKRLKSIGDTELRLTLSDGGFVTTGLIKTVIQSSDASSVLIIGTNDKILLGFDSDEYSDLPGLYDAINDVLIAISNGKKGKVQWSEYTTDVQQEAGVVASQSISKQAVAPTAK